MIIVSQEKEKIINFDNIDKVYIQDIILSTKTVYLVKCKIKNEDERLGEYATEERARTVLKMIVSMYQSSLLFQCVNDKNQEDMATDYKDMDITPFKFEMPKK